MGRRRRRVAVATVIALILVLAGTGLLSWPHIEEYFYENKVADLKKEFLDSIQNPPSIPSDMSDPDGTVDSNANDPTHPNNTDRTAFDLLYKYLKMENEKLFKNGQKDLVDAFSYEQPAVDLSAYGIKNNCIGFISIPSINIELPIYLGANTQNMNQGAVHLTNTSYPIGGDNTNSVIAAHRGYRTLMFRNIHNIKIGDHIIITNFRETLTYRATEIKIIDPTELAPIRIQSGRDMITLASCTPLGQNYQRYLLYCERTS